MPISHAVHGTLEAGVNALGSLGLDNVEVLAAGCHENSGEQEDEANQLRRSKSLSEEKPGQNRGSSWFSQNSDRDKRGGQAAQRPIEARVSDQLRAQPKRNHEQPR